MRDEGFCCCAWQVMADDVFCQMVSTLSFNYTDGGILCRALQCRQLFVD